MLFRSGHFIADCPNKKEQDAKKDNKRDKLKKGGKGKGYFKKKKYGQAHIGEEWNYNEESSSSEEEEEMANVAIQSTPFNPLRPRNSSPTSSTTPTPLLASWQKETR